MNMPFATKAKSELYLSKTRWYAVRAMPGSQRMACANPNAPDHRKGESIIERSLRNEGIDVYMPSFWKDVRHQRTNKVMGKRFPLLVGYAFVNITEADFERVRCTDGVMCFLRPSPDLPPAAFRDAEDIGVLMLADEERKIAYEAERAEKEKLANQHRRNSLNHHLGLILPKGRRRKISLRYHAEQTMHGLSPVLRSKVSEILAELEKLDGAEPLEKLRIAS